MVTDKKVILQLYNRLHTCLHSEINTIKTILVQIGVPVFKTELIFLHFYCFPIHFLLQTTFMLPLVSIRLFSKNCVVASKYTTLGLFEGLDLGPTIVVLMQVEASHFTFKTSIVLLDRTDFWDVEQACRSFSSTNV